MIYLIAYATFIFLLMRWLLYEFKPAVIRPRRQAGWLLLGVFFVLLAEVLAIVIGGKLGNFLLHAIGGGVASACIFTFFVRLFQPRLSWRTELVLLFMFVSTLGVCNELAEYAAELLLQIQLSFDTHDTWRDFVANSSGALLLWSLLKLLNYKGERKIPEPESSV